MRNPVLTPLQQAALAAAEANPVPRTEEAVLGAAWTATGLSDFGRTPDSIRERFKFYFDRFPVRAEID